MAGRRRSTAGNVAALDCRRSPTESAARLTPLPRIRPTRCLAALALLVLLFGLPRAFVMCTGGGRSHVEVAHAAGGCCGHAHNHARRAPAPERPAAPEADASCEHSGFVCELAPPPARGKSSLPPAVALLAAWSWPSFEAAPAPLAAVHPPATGPPRPGEHLSLRATTLLLL